MQHAARRVAGTRRLPHIHLKMNVTEPNQTELDRARSGPIRAGREWCRGAVNYDPEIRRRMWMMALGVAVGYITLAVVFAIMAFAIVYCVDLLS